MRGIGRGAYLAYTYENTESNLVVSILLMKTFFIIIHNNIINVVHRGLCINWLKCVMVYYEL